MGMGDKKQPFTPSYAPVRCDVSGHLFAPCAVRQCPEPHVIERYGTGGVANVCIYVCRRCKYKVTIQYCGALGCGYGLGKGIQA